MRIPVAMAALALPLALSACGEVAPQQNTQQIRVANSYNDRLRGLNDLYQRLTLAIAIRDNGKRCQRVEAAGEQGEYRGMARWVALCNDGRHWSVFIAANGDTQVSNCDDARALRLPLCRPVTPPPSDPNANATGNSS
jgi:hypothetical protein